MTASSDLPRLAYEASYAGTDPSCFTPWDELLDTGKAMWARVVQVVVGAGGTMKLVPIEPTSAMLTAAYRRMRIDPSCAPFSRRILLKGWDAMLAAAPPSGPAPERSSDQSTGGASLSAKPARARGEA